MFTRPFILVKSTSVLLVKSTSVLFRKISNNANNNYIPPTCYDIKDIKYDIIISELDKIKRMQTINYCLLLINTIISAIF
jgi:hypothetical protein